MLAHTVIKLRGDIMNTLNYKIDEDVKLIRELLNLSQAQFAQKIGVVNKRVLCCTELLSLRYK